MDRSQPDVPTEPSPDHADRPDADPRGPWSADRDRLLTIAGYADTLVEAVHRIDRAYEEAATVLAGARREAASIRADAEREAEHLTARAREELARLEFQIARLESRRHLIAVPPRPVPVAVPDPVTLAEYPSEADTAFRRAEPPPVIEREVTDSSSSAIANEPDPHPVDDEPIEDDVSAHVRSIRQLLEERAERREVDVVPPPRRGSFGAAMALAAALVIALGVAGWWFLRGGNDDNAVHLASAPRPAPARHADPPAATATQAATSTEPPAPSPPPQPEKVSVALKAERPTWVRIGSDGVLDRGRIMAAGQQQLITGDREIEVRTGDGGALLVSVNGGPETPLGKNGADAVKRFAAGGPLAGAPEAGTVATASQETEPLPASARSSVATSGIADPPAGPPRSERDAIAESDARWFDARYRGADAVLRTLQAGEFELLDQRRAGDRPEPGVRVERELRSLQIDTWADHGAASGVMIEHVRGGNPREIMSVFAETWVKRDGRWQLMGLRLTPTTDSASR